METPGSSETLASTKQYGVTLQDDHNIFLYFYEIYLTMLTVARQNSVGHEVSSSDL
jgi:hypothetical protein